MEKIYEEVANQSSTFQMASLRVDKGRQIVRLVNPTDFKIKFAIKTSPTMPSEEFIIIPEAGTIEPRNYINIVVNGQSVKAGQLNLFYWSRDLTKRKKYTRGLVPIQVSGVKVAKLEEIDIENPPAWSSVRILRVTFLLALIAYNIMIIKFSLYN